MNCLPPLSEGTGILLAGIFAALIAVVGWLGQSTVYWAVWLYRRKAAEFERLIALRSEIASNILFEQVYADADNIATIVDGMQLRMQTGEDVPPYTVIYRENIVFDRIKPDITSLPEDLIGAVVDYYLKSGGLNAILTDQRSDFYRLLSLDRAEQLWNQIATLAGETVRSGEHTKIMLDMRIRAFKRNRIVSATLLAAALVLTTVGLGPGLIRTAKALQPCPQSSNGADNRVHGAVHLLLGSNIVTSTVDV